MIRIRYYRIILRTIMLLLINMCEYMYCEEIFRDDFEATSLNMINWPTITGSPIMWQYNNMPGESYSLQLPANAEITSRVIDTTKQTKIGLSIYYRCDNLGASGLSFYYYSTNGWKSFAGSLGYDYWKNSIYYTLKTFICMSDNHVYVF